MLIKKMRKIYIPYAEFTIYVNESGVSFRDQDDMERYKITFEKE